MNIKNRVRNRLILPALCSLATMANSQTWTSLTELILTNTNHTTQLNKTDENPIRGFTPGFNVTDTNFPHSIVRKYLRFDDIFDSSNDTLKISYLDAEIKKVADQGRHFVIRPICYYPGDQPFWWANIPKKTIDGIQRPDWNHATTMTKFKKFIELLGARYKDDERLLMVELGLYGSWGEWNTSDSAEQPKADEMTVANRRILVDEYQKAFKRTNGQDKFLALRYTHALSSNPTQRVSTMDPILGNMAFYDDSFSYQTIGNASDRSSTESKKQTWFTAQAMYNMRTTDTYKNAPRAGEPRPETTKGWPIKVDGIEVPQYFGLFMMNPNHSIDKSYSFMGTTKFGKDEDFAKSVQATRQSWLTTQRLFNSETDQDEKNNGRKLIKQLGYQLVVTQQYVTRTGTNGANVGVKIKNNGVAPFYFNWPVEFIAKTSTAETSLGFSAASGTAWNLKDISAKEGSTVTTKTFTGTLTGLPSAACDVIMRFRNPLLDHSSLARPLRFLNLQQDTKKDGWITLASLAASGSTGGSTETPYIANGIYTIQRESGGAFLTATSSWNPITFGSTSGANTKWKIVNQPTLNQVAIISESNSNTMLEVDSSSVTQGSVVRLSGDATVRQHSTWKVERVSATGPYRFIPVLNSSFAMDAWEKSATEKVVHLWNSDATNTNQRFKVTLTN